MCATVILNALTVYPEPTPKLIRYISTVGRWAFAVRWTGLEPTQDGGVMRIRLRARAKITSHFRISSSGHLRPIFTHTILNVGLPTLAVVLPQVDPICPKSEREFCEVIFARALRCLDK